MIAGIPRTPLLLGLLGLLPMIWGVAEIYLPFIRGFTEDWINSWFYAPYATLRYAEIILAFMSGVLFGFAAKASGTTAAMAYKLSVIPALYTFLFVIGGVQEVAGKLAIGFVIVLGIDYLFHRQKLTPSWWMRLRLVLTVVMVACLLAIAAAPDNLLRFNG
jgi:hypothetical protein